MPVALHPIRAVAVLLAALSSLGSAESLAHDFWIEPSSFFPAAGSVIQVGLREGDEFQAVPLPRMAGKVEAFSIKGPRGEEPVAGRDGADPAGLARIPEPGLYVIGYRGRPTRVELGAPEFESYLREEGLEHVIARRRERGEQSAPGREIFSRCAKSLVRCGEGAGDGYDTPFGFTLELIPGKNPCAVSSEEELPIQLLREGRPCSDVLVTAVNRDEPDRPARGRTDADGRVTFRLAREGIWLIHAVHMVRANPDRGADWESLWTSLTFERR